MQWSNAPLSRKNMLWIDRCIPIIFSIDYSDIWGFVPANLDLSVHKSLH